MDNNFYQLNSSLSNVVIEYITEKIFTGEYKAGDRIIERKIAEDLQISRSPIREAIKVVQQQGLVEFSPRKGSYVAVKSKEDIKEIFSIRCLLESDIIEILIKEDLLNGDDFIMMEKITEEMDEVARSKESIEKKVYEMSKKDIMFHKYIWEKSKSKLRIKILSDMYLNLQLAMILDTNIEQNIEDSGIEHRLIIDALKNKDIEKAKNYLINHIVSYRARILE
ncbi:GntR family transcriptional regulator [Paraclostridium bifermentans]|uniref:GntR family transcriptional regulator n=1 Tax=Paraclostridium bifermentans TaxID=1490 RepID=UPI00359C6C2F